MVARAAHNPGRRQTVGRSAREATFVDRIGSWPSGLISPPIGGSPVGSVRSGGHFTRNSSVDRIGLWPSGRLFPPTGRVVHTN